MWVNILIFYNSFTSSDRGVKRLMVKFGRVGNRIIFHSDLAISRFCRTFAAVND